MSGKSDHSNLLNETNLFSGVSDKIRAQIFSLSTEVKYEADQVIYEPGDDAIDIYLLRSGLVRFSLATGVGAGSVSSGTVMRSRMIFGWAALVPEHPRRVALARCVEPSNVLVMNGDGVMEALRSDPKSGFKVMERLCAMIARNFMEQRD
jgi:toluene monooxygenase system ferredoxin subunit